MSKATVKWQKVADRHTAELSRTVAGLLEASENLKDVAASHADQATEQRMAAAKASGLATYYERQAFKLGELLK